MRKILFLTLLVFVTFTACKQQRYAVVSMNGERHKMDFTASQYYTFSTMSGQKLEPNFSSASRSSMSKLVKEYKSQLDKEMSKVLGQSAECMKAERPESLLTNLTADVMKKAGDKFTGGHCDLALMNVDGHRAALPKGEITVGGMFEIYSFENALVLVKLKGSVLIDIFQSYAQMGGAGVSSSVRLIIGADKSLIRATVDGKNIDPTRTYSLITLDYLADGNDGMEALKKADSVTPLHITLRDMMIDYIQEQTKEGKMLTSALDGRITVNN